MSILWFYTKVSDPYNSTDMTIYRNIDFSSNNWVSTFPYGQTKDTVQALEWYVKAADQGDAKAQFAAGVCFETAQGTEKDLDRAAPYGNATLE